MGVFGGHFVDILVHWGRHTDIVVGSLLAKAVGVVGSYHCATEMKLAIDGVGRGLGTKRFDRCPCNRRDFGYKYESHFGNEGRQSVNLTMHAGVYHDNTSFTRT